MIIELLELGEENARTAKELAKAQNMDIRDVMQAVRVERLAGQPICSTSKGYFIADCKQDLDATISRLYKQARETRRVAESMKTTRGELYDDN